MRVAFAVLVVATSGAAALTAWAADAAPPVQSIAIGDFDGDGKPDVAVGLPDVNSGKFKKAGVVRFYSGPTGALVRELGGISDEQGFGTSIAAVGDSDGDGATDLAVSAPYGDGAYIDFISGKTGKRIYVCTGGKSVAWADRICSLGDGSGKPRVDLAIRYRRKKEKEKKEEWVWRYVYSDKVAIGMAVTDGTDEPASLASLGDVNGDGYPDFAACRPTDDLPGMKRADLVRIVSGWYLSQGEGEGHSSPDLLFLRGSREGEALGLAVAPAGDWNGDGKADVLTGVPGDSAKKDTSWLVRVFSGKDGEELWKAAGAAGDVSMGGAALAGDADGDGKRDVAVGTHAANAKAGAVSMISAKDGSVLWAVKGAANEGLGEDVYACADADGDKVEDVVVVSPGAAVGGKKGNGYVRLLSGKTGAVISLINPLATK